MVERIDEIRIPQEKDLVIWGCGPFNSLYPLKTLNVFIGPNNSGKSRLLRRLFACNRSLKVGSNLALEIRSIFEGIDKLRPDLDRFSNEIAPHLIRIKSTPAAFGTLGQQPETDDELDANLRRLGTVVSQFSNYGDTSEEHKTALDLLKRKIINSAIQASQRPSSVSNHRFENSKFVYIPALRGMRPLPVSYTHLTLPTKRIV